MILKFRVYTTGRFSDFSYFLKLIISEYSVYTINTFLELLRFDVDDLKSRVYTKVSNEKKTNQMLMISKCRVFTTENSSFSN